MELLVLIVVAILAAGLVILALLATEIALEGGLVGLAINAVVGVLLLFLTNLFLSPPIPINLITVLICVIGGVVDHRGALSAADSLLCSRNGALCLGGKTTCASENTSFRKFGE